MRSILSILIHTLQEIDGRGSTFQPIYDIFLVFPRCWCPKWRRARLREPIMAGGWLTEPRTILRRERQGVSGSMSPWTRGRDPGVAPVRPLTAR